MSIRLTVMAPQAHATGFGSAPDYFRANGLSLLAREIKATLGGSAAAHKRLAAYTFDG